MLSWLFPLRCTFCQQLSEHIVCTGCRQALPWVNEQTGDCYAWFHFEHPIRELIHALKFKHTWRYANTLAYLMCKKLPTVPDALLPVPLHRKRLQARGFNQAIEIARPLARKHNIPLLTTAITRIKNTPPQSTLTRTKRLKNLKNAFQLETDLNQFKHIAVLDDVYTTGQTLHHITATLQPHFQGKLSLWCCAKTR